MISQAIFSKVFWLKTSISNQFDKKGNFLFAFPAAAHTKKATCAEWMYVFSFPNWNFFPRIVEANLYKFILYACVPFPRIFHRNVGRHGMSPSNRAVAVRRKRRLRSRKINSNCGRITLLAEDYIVISYIRELTHLLLCTISIRILYVFPINFSPSGAMPRRVCECVRTRETKRRRVRSRFTSVFVFFPARMLRKENCGTHILRESSSAAH